MTRNRIEKLLTNINTGIHSGLDAFDFQTTLYNALHNMDSVDAQFRYACSWVPDTDRSDIMLRVQSLLSDEIRLAGIGQSIFVSAEISDEITEAASTMLDSVLIAQDVFTPNGIISLEKPFIYEMAEKNSGCIEVWVIKAIAYCVVNTGINVFLYGNMHSVIDPISTDALILEKDSVRVLSDHVDGTHDYMSILNTIKKEPAHIELLVASSYGKPRLADMCHFDFNTENAKYDDGILELKKFMLALFRLSYEYLEVESSRANRNVRRRADRVQRPTDGYVVTLKLRRTKSGEGGDGSISSPSYAFRVRGHWKKAYLRSSGHPVGDPRAYRHVYIKDYIKGRGVFIDSTRIVKVEN
jgi:hypothetical protein